MSVAQDAGRARYKVPFDLQQGEVVVSIVRRHPVFLGIRLGRDIFFGIVPLIGVALIVGATAGFDGALGTFVLVLMVLWFIFWAVRTYFTWYKYQNDLWVVTDQRIVDSMKRHWFSHRMASADLINVEDISLHRDGVLATMFNFGDVVCQTAGAQSNFVLSGIAKPSEVLGIVDRFRDAARRELTRGNLL